MKTKKVEDTVGPSTLVKRTSHVRKKGGGKARLYACVPTRGGVRVKHLLAKASEMNLSSAKIKKWIPAMAKDGWLALQ